MDKKIEQVLREINAQYVKGAEEYCHAVAGKNRTEDKSEDGLKLDFKIQKIQKTDNIKLESDDEIDTHENDRKLKAERKNHNTISRQTEKEEKGGKETRINNRKEDKGKKGVNEENITQKHSIGKPMDVELEREMRNINEVRIKKQQEIVVSNDNDKTNKENVNNKVREEDVTQRQSTGKQIEKNMEWQMRNINGEHIEKQQERLSGENDQRSLADGIEKEEKKEKDEKTEEKNVSNKESQENRETNNQTRKIIEKEKQTNKKYRMK